MTIIMIRNITQVTKKSIIKIDLIIINTPDDRKSIRLLIEYANGNSDVTIFHGTEKQVRSWVSSLKAKDIYDTICMCFEK